MNPLRTNQNEISSLNAELFDEVKRLFSSADIDIFKKHIAEGHISNLRETVDMFECTGKEVSSMAFINHTLINFLDNIHNMYTKNQIKSANRSCGIIKEGLS